MHQFHFIINVLNIGEHKFDESFNTYFIQWITGLVEGGSYFDYYQKYWNFYKSNMKNKQSKTQIYWLNYEDLIINEESKRTEIKN